MSDERRELIKALAVASFATVSDRNLRADIWVSNAITGANELLAALDKEAPPTHAAADQPGAAPSQEGAGSATAAPASELSQLRRQDHRGGNMTPEKWQAIKERDKLANVYFCNNCEFDAERDRRALIAEVEAVTQILRDLLGDMAEDESQRHHSDKYRVYQVSPEVVEGASAYLAAREKTT